MKSIKKYEHIIKLIVVFLLFLFSSQTQWIPIKMFNLDPNNLSDGNRALLALFSNSILAILLFLIYFKDLKKYFKDFKKNKLPYMDIGFKAWFVGLMVMAVSNILINLKAEKIANNETAVRSILTAAPLAAFILTAILAPFVEEIIFRKAFKDVFKEKWLFIISSGCIFGALHVFGEITSLYDFLYLIPYCSLGISFSYMYYKTNNLMVNMVMHAIHNSIVTIIAISGAVLGIIL